MDAQASLHLNCLQTINQVFLCQRLVDEVQTVLFSIFNKIHFQGNSAVINLKVLSTLCFKQGKYDMSRDM